MRLLIVHPEDTYFAGAERMLGSFLNGLATQARTEITVAVSPGSRTATLIPPAIRSVFLDGTRPFSLAQLWRQARQVRRFRREFPFDVVHGWAARDWELAWLTGWLCGCPAIGTLHDHPNASFISGRRQWLMRWNARRGLQRVVCVSAAVQSACAAAGYPPDKLAVIHNGLPVTGDLSPRPAATAPYRLGFLGACSERKGLRGLFQILDGLPAAAAGQWELHLGGDAQDEAGRQLLAKLRASHAAKPWWPQVHWHGWVESPRDFLRTLDLLLLPSAEFDPFPTVLLEAGQAGVPALAARVGGVAEIVLDGQTGWLFAPGDWNEASQRLGSLLAQPDSLITVGQQARGRVEREFPASNMVAEYLRLYSTLMTND
jgi:glycosyltransferase involved in cell wall biosynthesis